MSSFGTDSCGLIADGVGPTRSSAHPPARSFELRDRCVDKELFSLRGTVDDSLSSLICYAPSWDTFVVVHLCMHAFVSQASAGPFASSFCGNGSADCRNCSGFCSLANLGNGHCQGIDNTALLHQRKRSLISLFHDDGGGHVDDAVMSGFCVIDGFVRCCCSWFSFYYILLGDTVPSLGHTSDVSTFVKDNRCSHHSIGCSVLISLPCAQLRTIDYGNDRDKSSLRGMPAVDRSDCLRADVAHYCSFPCSDFLPSASLSVRSVALEVAMRDFLLVLTILGYGEGLLLPTDMYPMVALGSRPSAISLMGRDFAEIIHCWHFGCFSMSLFGDLLATPLFGWLASQLGEVACLGVLCSSMLLIAGILLAYVGTFPHLFYVEASLAPFASVGLSTRVFGAKISGFKARCIKTRSNLGRGQCFWRAISNTQSAWRRAKQHSLAHMLPSKAHHSQLRHSAWATHVQIASYAEAHHVRVILLTVDHQRVLHFVPPQFSRTVYVLHAHNHFERIVGFNGKAYEAGIFSLLILVDAFLAFLMRMFLILELLWLFM